MSFKMALYVHLRTILFFLGCSITDILGQVTCPAPQPPSRLSYVADTSNVCIIRVCYEMVPLTQMFSCPTDPTYLMLLQSSNLAMFNACSGCLNLGVVTTTSSSVTPTTAKTVVDVQNDGHLIGGSFIGSLSIVACLDRCLADSACLAFDHDSRNNGCWFHDALTACSALQPKTFCIHYRLTDCGPLVSTTTPFTTTPAITPAVILTTPSVTPPVLTTTPPIVTTTTTTPPTTTSIVTVIPNGFVAVTTGSNVLGGMRQLVFVSEQQCLDFCLMESFCLAVDYNFLDSTCFIHFQGTYCDALTVQLGTNHYQRLPCVTDPAIGNLAFEMRTQFHVLGGSLQGSGLSLLQCLTACYTDITCQGVDFDRVTGVCYVFTVATVCDPLVPMDNSIHVSLIQCTIPPAVPAPVVTTAAPAVTTAFVAPIGSFIQLLFAGPSTLPSGWQAYPGMQVNNGAPIGTVGMTGDQCIQLCLTNPSCHAVDFNSADGTCYEHDITQKCDALVAVNEVYHAKRDPVCVVITGTITPYPAPLAVAP